MKKKFQFAVLFMLISYSLFAQYSIDWIRPADTYQKTGVMMAADNLDNLIVAGFIVSNNIYTRKYDKFGNLLWENISSSGISGNYERPNWVNCDSSNNIFVVGHRYTGTSFQYPNAIVVNKYSAGGALLWKRTIDMSIFVNSFISFNLRSEVDQNGNLYIGTVAASPSGFVLLKLDPDGNTLFINNNNANGVTMFRSMRLKGSRVVFSGSSSDLSAAPVIAWDTLGNLLWTASFLGQSGTDIEVDDSNNVYLLSSYSNQVTASSGQDIKVYKINSSGTQLWVNNFDFGGYEYPTRFQLAGGRLTIIGYGNISASYFDWITFQLNSAGGMLWNVRYNETSVNDEQSYFLDVRDNGEVFVTGRGGPVYTYLGSSYLRMITVRYDNTGVRKWVDSVNIYSGRGVACSIATDNSLYVLSDASMTAFHFLDHDGSPVAAVPVGLAVSNVTSSSALFSWNAVSGASLYHLRYKSTAATAWTVISTDQLSINLTGLTPNTVYDYACEAVNSGGPSGYSATQTFTTPSAPLAVIGFNFNAVRQGQNVLLNWSTLSEKNSAYFEVQRSFDGLHFSTVGQIPAAGYSNTANNYRFMDLNVAPVMVFYRLKMVDADAEYKLSMVRVVSKAGESLTGFLVYPNPAVQNINIVLQEAASSEGYLQFFTPLGQMLRNTRFSSGTQTMSIDISDLPRGNYFIKLLTGKTILVNKLVKK